MQVKNETFLTFFSRLDKLMTERGIGNSVLARKIGVSHVQVANYRKPEGQMPRADVFYAIAKHFNVSMEWLLSGEGAEDIATDASVLEWRNRALAAERRLQEIQSLVFAHATPKVAPATRKVAGSPAPPAAITGSKKRA